MKRRLLLTGAAGTIGNVLYSHEDPLRSEGRGLGPGAGSNNVVNTS